MINEEVKLMGVCAFCNNHNHKFEDNAWYNKKHEQGWHSCDVYKGFRFNKPLCDCFEWLEVNVA